MNRYPAAPLDRTARVATGSVWALAAGLIAAGGALLATRETAAGAALAAGGAGTAALAAFFRARRPVAYVVGEGVLEVERSGARPVRYEGELADVRRGRLGLRVAGDGGVYGYLGRYRAGGETVSAFVSSLADVVLLRVGSRRLAISPADPDDFVRATGGGNA